jgi:uncharacterized protein YndB with AHSA1/START domain
MPDILHRIGIKASPAESYKALATLPGLAGWWTTDTRGRSEVGGVIAFRFGDRGGFDMKVLALDSARRVLWQVIEGPAEWLGTTVSFDLAPEDECTLLRFKHRDWHEPTDFMHHCSTKCATFLMSLKSFVESGKGAPYPEDVRITNTAD